MFLKFHLKSPKLSLFPRGRGGLGKTTLSLSKDVTIRLGGRGVKGKSDNVILYDFFLKSDNFGDFRWNFRNMKNHYLVYAINGRCHHTTLPMIM